MVGMFLCPISMMKLYEIVIFSWVFDEILMVKSCFLMDFDSEIVFFDGILMVKTILWVNDDI